MRMQITPYSIVPSTHTGTVCPQKSISAQRERNLYYLEVPCTKTFWRVIAWVIGTCDSPFIANLFFCCYCFSTPQGKEKKKKRERRHELVNLNLFPTKLFSGLGIQIYHKCFTVKQDSYGVMFIQVQVVINSL